MKGLMSSKLEESKSCTIRSCSFLRSRRSWWCTSTQLGRITMSGTRRALHGGREWWIRWSGRMDRMSVSQFLKSLPLPGLQTTADTPGDLQGMDRQNEKQRELQAQTQITPELVIKSQSAPTSSHQRVYRTNSSIHSHTHMHSSSLPGLFISDLPSPKISILTFSRTYSTSPPFHLPFSPIS